MIHNNNKKNTYLHSRLLLVAVNHQQQNRQFDQENLEPANEITSLNKNETSKLAKLSFDSKLLKKF